MFMHELGHAIALLSVGEITGGFVHNDRDPNVNATNDSLIRDNCIAPIRSLLR